MMVHGGFPLLSVLTGNIHRGQHNSVALGTWKKLSAKTNAILLTFYTR